MIDKIDLIAVLTALSSVFIRLWGEQMEIINSVWPLRKIVDQENFGKTLVEVLTIFTVFNLFTTRINSPKNITFGELIHYLK
jgi:hypothetical protein